MGYKKQLQIFIHLSVRWHHMLHLTTPGGMCSELVRFWIHCSNERLCSKIKYFDIYILPQDLSWRPVNSCPKQFAKITYLWWM